MIVRAVLLIAGIAMLASCAGGPVYRAATQADGYGYRDNRLTSDRFRVSFSGDYGTARESVENFALFRAADVALQQGATRFRIVARQTSPITVDGGGPSTRIGYGFGYPYWSSGIGYSTGGITRTRYETVLEIQVGPQVPNQGPEVYDAEQLKRNLSPSVAAAQN